MGAMNHPLRSDTIIRFAIGGAVVALVYILAALVPVRAFAGVFAAFPGVMAAAVGLCGWRQGSPAASEVARGSIAGMLGGLCCVLTTLVVLPIIGIWWAALGIAVVVWFAVSILIHRLLGRNRADRQSSSSLN